MDTHADIGFQLLTGSGSDVLELAAVIARSHHERFDGSGYPHGLVGADDPDRGSHRRDRGFLRRAHVRSRLPRQR